MSRPPAVATRKGASLKGPRSSTNKRPFSVDLSSYDRTDPFTAFNILRKLLGRLVSCHYKMAPEEHTLSMHLLAIVEPFVNLKPCRRTIVTQPSEVLDIIAANISGKRDLLSFGLTCKRLRDIVFPRHWEYRVVSARISSGALWNHLIVNRALAQNVRVLEILDERSSDPERIPSDIPAHNSESTSQIDMHADHEQRLMSALCNMTELETLHWSCNHSLVSIENIWPILLKHQSLKELKIHDNLVFSKRSDDEEGEGSVQLVMPRLTAAEFQATKHTFGLPKVPELTRISAMLHTCPNLERLHIGYMTNRSATSCPPADALLEFGRWPSLRFLTLTNLWTSHPHGLQIASTFLTTHPKLEFLHLELAPRVGPGALIIPEGALPALRELHVPTTIALSLMVGTSCLDVLRGISLTGHAGRDATLLNAIAKQPLKRLELSAFGEMEDIRRVASSAPGLTWLDVGSKRPAVALPKHHLPNIVPVAEWAEILSTLPDLTAFHGIRFFYEVSDGSPASLTTSDRSRFKKNDETAGVLTWRCPKLRRLDHWEENGSKIVVLVRSPEAETRWQVRRIKI